MHPAIVSALNDCELAIRTANEMPFLIRMQNEHGADLSAWWQPDPLGGSDLDIAQYCRMTQAVAGVAREELSVARLVHVSADTALVLHEPINDASEASRIGLRIHLGEPNPVYLDFTVDGNPDQRLSVAGLNPPALLVGALAWQRVGALNIVPFFRMHEFSEPWAHIMWDADRKLDVPFHAHPGLHVYGAPEVGLLVPSIKPGSDSICGKVSVGSHNLLALILAPLDALSSGRATLVDAESEAFALQQAG